jgi:hypothetical protein
MVFGVSCPRQAPIALNQFNLVRHVLSDVAGHMPISGLTPAWDEPDGLTSGSGPRRPQGKA